MKKMKKYGAIGLVTLAGIGTGMVMNQPNQAKVSEQTQARVKATAKSEHAKLHEADDALAVDPEATVSMANGPAEPEAKPDMVQVAARHDGDFSAYDGKSLGDFLRDHTDSPVKMLVDSGWTQAEALQYMMVNYPNLMSSGEIQTWGTMNPQATDRVVGHDESKRDDAEEDEAEVDDDDTSPLTPKFDPNQPHAPNA